MGNNEQIIIAKEKTEKMYNELTMRMNEILSVYPDIENAPEEIKEEYYLNSGYRKYFNCVLYSDLGMEITEEGYYIDSWRKNNFLMERQYLNDFYSKNEKKSFNPSGSVLKPLDVDNIEEKFRSVKSINEEQMSKTVEKVAYDLGRDLLKCSFADFYKGKEIIAAEKEKTYVRIEKELEEQRKKDVEKAKQKFEEMKKAYDSLSLLKKTWYKMTKKAINQNGTWIVNEPEELGESNGRSIK